MDGLHPKPIKTNLRKEAKRKQIHNEYHKDSLQLDNALKKALQIAKQNTSTESFSNKWNVRVRNNSHCCIVNLDFGPLFSKNDRHLLIRRFFQDKSYLNVYLYLEKKFTPVISYELEDFSYINDSIGDINGDGIKDFVVHWYPPAGCCIADVYNVYLNQGSKATFTVGYELINPTFSPKEKLIRGITYDHPGEAALYKYKWNGLEADTIEYIYNDVKNKGHFIKTKQECYSKEKKGQALKSIPIEYHNIKSYGWFALY